MAEIKQEETKKCPVCGGTVEDIPCQKVCHKCVEKAAEQFEKEND